MLGLLRENKAVNTRLSSLTVVRDGVVSDGGESGSSPLPGAREKIAEKR